MYSQLISLVTVPILARASIGKREAWTDDVVIPSGTNLTFGNFYNYWVEESSGFDLTRGNATGAFTLQASTASFTFQPARSAMVIVDMQSPSSSLLILRF